ncbi:MAG: hypothetical protein GX837_08010 [Methanomicrobiales archaeon]|nr:hypothetical protein [Methanomicrobiales archaeon]
MSDSWYWFKSNGSLRKQIDA